jgi:hypothetical protein
VDGFAVHARCNLNLQAAQHRDAILEGSDMTPSEFIEKAPLYTQVQMKDFRPPDSITRICERCNKETTWLIGDQIDGVGSAGNTRLDFKAAAYACGLCRHSNLVVIYELLNWSEVPGSQGKLYQHKAVRKIGQVPPDDVDVPPELVGRLGSTAAHYKKALISRNSNYGIGAMAYLRRVVDEKTDELIDVMADLARTYEAGDEEIQKLLAAKAQGRYDQKLQVAAELIPSALRPGGVNPLGQLYKHTSIGLHGKTDDECIAIFDDVRADFEYVFRNLHNQAEERSEFIKRVQQRAGGGNE